MGHIISFLSRFDAAIQRWFDSVCFFLMSRFGIRKSSIRYLLYASAIVGCGAIVVNLVHKHQIMLACCAALNLLFYLYGQHANFQLDQQDESNGRNDRIRHTLSHEWSVPVLKIACVVLLVVMNSLPEFVGYRLLHVGVSVWAVSLLMLCYLARTPMNPPTEKAREHVGTPQPAPAKS